MQTWDEEVRLIKIHSERYGLDPYFIAAIRKAEGGSKGGKWGEFGVPSAMAPSYKEQLLVTCATVRNNIIRYGRLPYIKEMTADRHSRLNYSLQFIEYFANIWAPIGAANDPKGLNRNWYRNCTTFYFRFCREGF